MNYYRLYLKDSKGKHFVDVRSFSANSDDEAIVEAGVARPGVSRELWNSGRRIWGLRS